MGELIGKQIILRPLVVEDVSDEYVNWMNNYEIVKYTESRFRMHTKESLREFVEQLDDRNHMFAILDKETSTHIGNIKLGDIEWHHRSGVIGIIVGCPEFFGRGIGTEAHRLVMEYGFKVLGLHRIIIGAYELNKPELRIMEKVGFKEYARAKQAYFFEGKYIDGIFMDKLNPYEKQ